ncbi:MAG: hypothetical protein ABIK31_05055 [candidate division WOR-3 bacterium]
MNHQEKFRIQASKKHLLTVNLGGIILGVFLLLLLLMVRHRYTLGLLIVGIGILIIYMLADYLIWQNRGIRIIEIDQDGITLYRGKNKTIQSIQRNQITDINIFKKLNRRIVTIILGGEVIKPAAGITLFKGERIRIADDAFDDNDFTVLIEKLKQLKPY